MKIVNLFAGYQTWLVPFRERGHETWATDIVARPGIDLAIDILDLDPRDVPYRPDLLVASPDCTAFSVASISTHWGGGWRAYEPKTDTARNRIALVRQAVEIVRIAEPRFVVFENPRGVLRKLHLLNHMERRTVWYCHYGNRDRAKPTDLWGDPFPRGFGLRPVCHNQRPDHLSSCCCRDHHAAPRGAKTGTQGRDKDARSFIPYQLASELCRTLEEEVM